MRFSRLFDWLFFLYYGVSWGKNPELWGFIGSRKISCILAFYRNFSANSCVLQENFKKNEMRFIGFLGHIMGFYGKKS